MPQMTKYGEARELLIEARRLLEAEHSGAGGLCVSPRGAGGAAQSGD